MNNFSNHVVAKAGGTSMSRPELVAEQLSEQSNQASILVVSAPGLDNPAGFTAKTTDMLRSYQINPTTSAQHKIQERYDHIASSIGSSAAAKIVDEIPQDIQSWSAAGAPLDALGEYWSARQFAAYSGRRFIDAQKIIKTDSLGNIDISSTKIHAQKEIDKSEEIVVPGYYGADSAGQVRLLGRGGSDITGAALALATNARRYDNWSDVPGFLTADPRKVDSARLNSCITYREAREMGSNGSQLLHPAVIKLLGKTGMPTIMKNTFAQSNDGGTLISDSRDWAESPLCGITGLNAVELSFHEFGINEIPGATTDIYNWLKNNKISYAHTATGTDDVSIFLDESQSNSLYQNIESFPTSASTSLSINEVGILHIVGEGLAQSSSERTQTLASAVAALECAGIEYRGCTDVSRSASLTIFINPSETVLSGAIKTIHQSLFDES